MSAPALSEDELNEIAAYYDNLKSRGYKLFNNIRIDSFLALLAMARRTAEAEAERDAARQSVRSWREEAERAGRKRDAAEAAVRLLAEALGPFIRVGTKTGEGWATPADFERAAAVLADPAGTAVTQRGEG